MNNFFREHHQLIFQEWISPSEAKGAKVLDLGSQTGWLGEYCMMHGAADYVGVEIDEFHIIDSRNHYPNLTFYNNHNNIPKILKERKRVRVCYFNPKRIGRYGVGDKKLWITE